MLVYVGSGGIWFDGTGVIGNLANPSTPVGGFYFTGSASVPF
jgi:hypothetical protein